MKYSLFLILIILFFACNRPKPQLPANKINTVDSSEIALMNANEKLISFEDSVLTLYVNKIDSTFIKNDLGFWYKINTKTSRKALKLNDNCTITYSVYTLDNQKLFHKTEKIVIGKKQLIFGLEELIKLMHLGESASLILPWYLAYGLKGDGKSIQPYTSLKLYVDIK